MGTRSVITLAFGKAYYLGLAANLARSFRIWHRDGGVSFSIVTDLDDALPGDLGWVDCRRVPKGVYDSGFGAKLHLGALGNADANLFIDADCLVFGNLGALFDRWRGLPFALVGESIDSGEFFGDVASRCRAFSVKSVPRLVGSVYYWEKGPLSARLFSMAQASAGEYDSLGFVRLRGMPNEEPLVSVAFAQLGLVAQQDDGTIKADAMSYRVIERCDVTAGRPRLTNPRHEREGFPTWLRLQASEPLILHFNDSYAQRPPYLREASRLEMLRSLPAPLAAAASWAFTTLPYLAAKLLKDAFRPFYAFLFGRRRIGSSPRL